MDFISPQNTTETQGEIKKQIPLSIRLVLYTLFEVFFVLLLLGLIFFFLNYFHIINLSQFRFFHQNNQSSIQSPTSQMITVDKKAIISYLENTLKNDYVPYDRESGQIKVKPSIVSYGYNNPSKGISLLTGQVTTNQAGDTIQKFSLLLVQNTILAVSTESAQMLTKKYIKNSGNYTMWQCGTSHISEFTYCSHNELGIDGSTFFGMYGNKEILVYYSCFIPKKQLTNTNNTCP